MKNKLLRFLSIVMIGFMFLACENPAGNTDDSSSSKNNSGNNSTSQQQNGGGSKDNSGGTQQGNGGKQNGSETQQGDKDKQSDSESTQETKIKLGVQFNFEGAKALAKLEEKQNSSRAATNVDDLGDLVKIMADGSMENAITVGENCSLSDIVAIYKSPKEDSKDIFIVFSGKSTLGYDDNGEIRVGQLICIHENGSIADILKKDDSTDSWNSHESLRTESVTFDADGNLYFISSDNGDMIYQYNPATDELTKMVAAVENTYYAKMQIDDEGQWIFVSGHRNSANYFLRAIPINNPNSFVNIYYSSNSFIDADKWTYDAKNGKMYFIVNDGNKNGLFIASKTGGFKDKTFIHRFVGEGFENDLFESIQVYSYKTNDWASKYKTNGVFDATKPVQQIAYSITSFYDRKTQEYKSLSLDDVDIRFDKYNSSTDCLKALAVLSAGKKNEEAFKAFDNSIGKTFLYNMYGKSEDGKNWFEYDANGEGYSHNFLADILYIKDTDTLLVDSDKVLFTYYDYAYNEDYSYIYDENGNHQYVMKSVKGSDLIRKNENGFYNGYDKFDYITTGDDYGSIIKTYALTPKYYNSDGTVNSAAILEYLYSFCNVEGTKEFTLQALKNDETYGALYSTLKNEKAIEWITSDVEKLDLFAQFAGIYYGYNSAENKNLVKLNYSSFMNMLSKTCFIAGTDKKAITWNWDDLMYDEYGTMLPVEIQYAPSGDGVKLSSTDTGVYYEYYNTSGTDPYYYIVQVADADGKLVELVNKLPLPAGKVVQSEKNKDRILLQYSVMDDNGAELGYHHIYSVEMATGKVTNCFDSVPNRNSLEVVSFNSAGDLLYYSAVRGTSVENGIVNIVTNEYNPLTVQRKMVAVYTFN